MIGESAQVRERDDQLSTLLGSTLETIIHQLLYQRIIYPPESFVLHRHLGVRCYASRVPQVSQYISKFLEVAVPSVVRGVASSIVFFVLKEEVVASNNSRGVGERTGGTEVVERFVFEFDVDQVVGTIDEKVNVEGAVCSQQDEMDIEDLQKQSADKKDSELVAEARSQLERSLKECLLRCIALRKRRRRANERQENMSFKLSMRTKVEPAVKDCSELTNALKEGDFMIPANDSCHFSKSGSLRRPIKDFNLTNSCGMRMSFGMEIEPS